VREQTTLVEKALALGELKSTKNRVTRTVDLLAPLAADLRRWRMASGRLDERALVFPPARSAGPWSDNADRSWRRKRSPRRRCEARADAPYDLRHSLASLLIAEGRSVLEVAEQMGHAPTMSLDVYGHVLAELAGQPKRPAADPSLRRAKSVRVQCARASECESAETRKPA
jgi:integrase